MPMLGWGTPRLGKLWRPGNESPSRTKGLDLFGSRGESNLHYWRCVEWDVTAWGGEARDPSEIEAPKTRCVTAGREDQS